MIRSFTRVARGETHQRLVVAVILVTFLFGLVGIMQMASADTETVTLTVNTSAGDARSDGGFRGTERETLVGAGDGVNANVVGLYFGSTGIPKGATITSVKVSMMKKKTEWSRMIFDCAFEAVDSSQPFSSSSAPIDR
ncbi:MAG TPA: hypothetical protein VFV93_16315, partial [Thermomicrobiales bacterium]|nr:hypothetical protein [Thermomicrobiales bacterium]